MSINKNYFESLMLFNAIKRPHYLAAILEYLDDSLLENSDAAVIFPVVRDFFDKHGIPPTATEIKVALNTDEKLKSFANLIVQFKTFDTNINEDELFANTETYLREKAVFKAIKKSAEHLANKTLQPEHILPEFEHACTINLFQNIGFDYFERIDEHCENLSKKQDVIPTGWKWLDERIGGGLLKDGRELVVFVGRTNIGKSIFLGNVAVNLLKQNKKVLLVSMEMSEDLYAKRFSTQISKIPINDLLIKTKDLKNSVENFKNANNEAKLIIKEYPPSTITVSHLNSYIKRLYQLGYKFDAIIVDYLNLFKPSKVSGKDGSYENIKAISEQLRALSYTYNVPVVSASQLNRKGMSDKDPDLDAISESVGMSFTADVQLSIWASPEDRSAGVINMKTQKNRFGPCDEITSLSIDYDTLTLSENSFSSGGSSPTSGDGFTSSVESALEKLEGI